ncbi:MAG: hypothetical protein ACREO3_08125 [Arenimonas sp.]
MAIDFDAPPASIKPGEPATARVVAGCNSNFFNTTRETGEQLRTARATAARQDELVLRIFERARRPLSPSQVWQSGGGDAVWLLTSVRRSITNLSAGDVPLLAKTADKRIGAHGRCEHLWRIP